MLMSGKQILNFGIGQIKCAGLLGADQREIHRVVVAAFGCSDLRLDGCSDEVFDADTAKRCMSFHLTKEWVGKINGGPHMYIFT